MSLLSSRPLPFGADIGRGFAVGPALADPGSADRSLRALRAVTWWGGVATHLVLALVWHWSGGLVFAVALAVHAVLIAPLAARKWPERLSWRYSVDAAAIATGAALAKTPFIALPWLLILFLVPMAYAGTRAALAVLAAGAISVPISVLVFSHWGVSLVVPLATSHHLAYFYVGLFGGGLFGALVSLVIGATTIDLFAASTASMNALKQERSQLETLFTSIPTAIAEFDMSEVMHRLAVLRERSGGRPGTRLPSNAGLVANLIAMIEVVRVNPAWAKAFGGRSDHLLGAVGVERIPVSIAAIFKTLLDALYAGETSGWFRAEFLRFDGIEVYGSFGFHIAGAPTHPDYSRIIVTVVDETEREHILKELDGRNQEMAATLVELNRVQVDLIQGHKMEAIGVLASGIAHEINTPIQFVGDNVRFLGVAADDLLAVIQSAAQLVAEAREASIRPETLGSLSSALDAADIDFLIDELPAAARQAIEGVERVAAIVHAMKEFAHPGEDELAAGDLNQALESTVTVSRNEWKYLADLELELDPNLGLVPMLVGPLNQVVLNLIVNAAHAIADSNRSGKGKITVRSIRQEEWAVVSVSDTGCGIPPGIRDRIFEPFYTTKEVGRGSGQGLAIAHQVVVERHNGEIEVESEVGVGTTFHIRIPLLPVASSTATPDAA